MSQYKLFSWRPKMPFIWWNHGILFKLTTSTYSKCPFKKIVVWILEALSTQQSSGLTSSDIQSNGYTAPRQPQSLQVSIGFWSAKLKKADFVERSQISLDELTMLCLVIEPLQCTPAMSVASFWTENTLLPFLSALWGF